MEISNLIKKQEEYLNLKITAIFEQFSVKYPEINIPIMQKIILKEFSKVRKETAEAVCDKMIGEECPETPITAFSDGYNARIKEEKEIKKQIIKQI